MPAAQHRPAAFRRNLVRLLGGHHGDAENLCLQAWRRVLWSRRVKRAQLEGTLMGRGIRLQFELLRGLVIWRQAARRSALHRESEAQLYGWRQVIRATQDAQHTRRLLSMANRSRLKLANTFRDWVELLAKARRRVACSRVAQQAVRQQKKWEALLVFMSWRVEAAHEVTDREALRCRRELRRIYAAWTQRFVSRVWGALWRCVHAWQELVCRRHVAEETDSQQQRLAAAHQEVVTGLEAELEQLQRRMRSDREQAEKAELDETGKLLARVAELEAQLAAEEANCKRAEKRSALLGKRLDASEETVAALHRAKGFALRQSALMWEHTQQPKELAEEDEA